MESVIYSDSPLADYLEEGNGDSGWASTQLTQEPPSPSPSSPSPSPSFAPRGRPTARARFRQKIPQKLHLKIPEAGTVARIHNTCSRAVNARLGRVDNARFLEQFRYIIVASQMLSGQVNAAHYNPLDDGQRSALENTSSTPSLEAVSVTGATLTAASAFFSVWIIHWARGGVEAHTSLSRALIAVSLLLVLAAVLYAYVRRQWLHYVRHQAVVSATNFVANSQNFDAVATGAITLIQEVELVSRGYRISNPVPPISRLEERSQTRRCLRLRKTLLASLATALPHFTNTVASMRPLAEPLDLDKYFDIYDLTATDVQDAETGYSESEFEDVEALKSLRTLLFRLHTLRRIFLCCLLALDADGGKPDFQRWRSAIDAMQCLSSVLVEGTEQLRTILSEEEQFPIPSTPRTPLAPGRERVRMQLRKLGSLSQGIRGLQAKMHILRDESDRAIDESHDVSELGTNLMTQYESIGGDLRMLMQEWESGKAALMSTINKNERRMSITSGGLRSPTVSLGGQTIVDASSPSEATEGMSGEDRGRWSMTLSNSDSEEIFEAIAAAPPSMRSKLTREERIMKMKEDRARIAAAREKGHENTNMLRELESVISLRPKGRTSPTRAPGHVRVTSL